MKLIWDVTFILGILAGLTFMVGYAINARGRWYHYRTGWHLMSMALAVTATLAGLLWQAITGGISGPIWYAITLSVVVSMWHQTYLLFETSRDNPDLRSRPIRLSKRGKPVPSRRSPH